MTATENPWSRFTVWCHPVIREPATRAKFYFGIGCSAPSIEFMMGELEAWLNELGCAAESAQCP